MNSFEPAVHLTRDELPDRSFILGNKRALSLTLPVSSGSTPGVLHPHKWYGAYLYGRKYLEGQVVRARLAREHTLSRMTQTGFSQDLVSACRKYEVEGVPCIEDVFVPDGVQGIVWTFSGEMAFSVEPEFDMRFYRALSAAPEQYEVEMLPRGAVISNTLPSGTYDDLTETFLLDSTADGMRIYAAVEVVGDDARVELLPARRRTRAKAYRKDLHRRRAVGRRAPDDVRHDHAPLWQEVGTRVYAPVRLHLHRHGTVLYGFGSSREEALAQLDALRERLPEHVAEKRERALGISAHASFRTGVERVDRAHDQVLSRLMDALVARDAVAQDTALAEPTTMILAGNRYFHDSWKRDENIALGFLLALGFYDLARDIVGDTWRHQDPVTGRLPQRVRAGENPPYHSSDGTLWALLRLHQYWRCTGDEVLLREKLPMVVHFFERSLDRAVLGMLPSGRTTDPDYLWETWMDTPVTPRDGFPIEIQMLWIACLRRYRPILEATHPEVEARMAAAESEAWRALERFNVRGMPADSLDTACAPRDLITPNPYFCFGVGLDLGTQLERTMRAVGRRQLAGRQGIVTLAPDDWPRVYPAEFLADRSLVRGRRMKSVGRFNYHRGLEWNWLAQFFVRAELKYGDPDAAFRRYLRNQVEGALQSGGIGGISELHHLGGTLGPEYQAWSMSGLLESLHAFAGVEIDVPGKRISVTPQLPSEWPMLSLRKWYRDLPLDVTVQRNASVRTLTIEFPDGVDPDVTLDVGFVVRSSESIEVTDVRLAGLPQYPRWHQHPIAGTRKSRLSCVVPAAGRTEVTVVTHRVSRRYRTTA